MRRFLPLMTTVILAWTSMVPTAASCAVDRGLANPDTRPKPIGPGDECKVYRALIVGSGLRPVGERDTYRLQPHEDGSDFPPARTVALRRAILARTGGEESPWNRVSPERFTAAFSAWRGGGLAACDWQALTHEVVAPAYRDLPVSPVVVTPGSDADVAFTRVFFADDENALILVREYWPHRNGFTRKLILATRDNTRDVWSIFDQIIEDLCFACPSGHNRRYPPLPR